MIDHSLNRYPPGPLNMLGAMGLTWRHACQMVFSPLQFMTAMT
jgi:hypothetical protein